MKRRIYKMNDKAAAVSEIQRYLQNAESTNGYIAPSGIYDENTRAAVISFQTENGIKPSGKVNHVTFTRLYDDYVKRTIFENIQEISRQNIKFPLKPGDFGEEIELLNKMLAELLDFYGVDHSLRASKYFSESTRLAYLAARELFGLDNETLDHIFYNRLLTEISQIRKL